MVYCCFLHSLRFEDSTPNFALYNALMTFCEMFVWFDSKRESLHVRHALRKVTLTHWFTVSVRNDVELYNAATRNMAKRRQIDHLARYESLYGTDIDDVWARPPRHSHNT